MFDVTVGDGIVNRLGCALVVIERSRVVSILLFHVPAMVWSMYIFERFARDSCLNIHESG